MWERPGIEPGRRIQCVRAVRSRRGALCLSLDRSVWSRRGRRHPAGLGSICRGHQVSIQPTEKPLLFSSKFSVRLIHIGLGDIHISPSYRRMAPMGGSSAAIPVPSTGSLVMLATTAMKGSVFRLFPSILA